MTTRAATSGGAQLLAGSAPESVHTLFFVETAALWGGPQKRLFRLARAWAARGHATAVAALRGDEYSDPSELEALGLPIFSLTSGGKEVLKSFHISAARSSRALVRLLRPRLVFTMETLVDYQVRMGLLWAGVPVVTLLGIDRWSWEQKLHRRLMMGWLALHPGAIVANSARVLDGWLRVLGPSLVERRPHTVIPNPVDPSEFEARFERDTPGLLVVGGLGRFQLQKGFDLLLDACAALPAELDGRRVVLRLQGRGMDEVRLRKRAEELNLGSRVEFMPFTQRVEAFLHALDVLVVPSRWAGFENVALEGVLCGTPTLISTGTGLEALQHDPCFRPFEPTVEQLARALRSFLERARAERVELARAQHRLVLAELDAARIAARFEEFLTTSGLLARAGERG